MPTSLYRFSDVQAKNAKPQHIIDMIAARLRANEDECYVMMERYLIAPGITGSKAFDQAYAIQTLLDYDSPVVDGQRVQGEIAKAMETTPTLTHRVLYDYLVKALRKAGFSVSHGRITGLLENKKLSEGDDDLGSPDIQ